MTRPRDTVRVRAADRTGHEDDAMAMVLRVSSGGPPPGAYSARFVGVEPTPASKENDYGPGLRWTFEVVGGAQAGARAHRVTGATPSAKNGCGKMLSGVLGRALTDGEDVDLSPYVGRHYLIVVSAGPSGGTRVESVLPTPPTA